MKVWRGSHSVCFRFFAKTSQAGQWQFIWKQPTQLDILMKLDILWHIHSTPPPLANRFNFDSHWPIAFDLCLSLVQMSLITGPLLLFNFTLRDSWCQVMSKRCNPRSVNIFILSAIVDTAQWTDTYKGQGRCHQGCGNKGRREKKQQLEVTRGHLVMIHTFH